MKRRDVMWRTASWLCVDVGSAASVPNVSTTASGSRGYPMPPPCPKPLSPPRPFLQTQGVGSESLAAGPLGGVEHSGELSADGLQLRLLFPDEVNHGSDLQQQHDPEGH